MARRKGQVALTVEEILQRQDELSRLTVEQLELMSRDYLRERCTGCLNIKDENGKLLNKQPLIDKILEWTEPLKLEKIRALAVTAESLQGVDIEGFVKDAVNRIDYKIAASLIKGAMVSKYEPSYIVKGLVPRTIDVVTSLKDADYASKFATELRLLTADMAKDVNNTYRLKTVPSYSEDKRMIDFAWVINWATEQLKLKRSWKLVTLALTLTSGRRPVEIHSTGNFIAATPNEKLLEYPITKGWVSFTGQAKEKKDMLYKTPVGTYTIPLLVPTELWLDGYNYLVANGKAGKDANGEPIVSKEKLNKNYSKEISTVVKQVLAVHNIEKWYDCRDFYAASYRDIHQYLKTLSDDNPYKKLGEEHVLSLLLGHTEKDIYTQQSYAKMAIKFDYNAL